MAENNKPRSPAVVFAALLLGSTGVVAGAGITMLGLFGSTLSAEYSGVLIVLPGPFVLGADPSALLIVGAGLFVMGVAPLVAVQIIRRRSWARRAGIALASCLVLAAGAAALLHLGIFGPTLIVLAVLLAIAALLLSLPASTASFRSDVGGPSRQ